MIPTSVAEVSAEFVAAALHPPGTAVAGCHPEALNGERGITGAVLRLRLDGGAGPSSLIAKLSPADPGLRAQLSAMGFFEREVSFYRTLAAETPVPTPRCYFADVDPSSGHALLLLEDLASARNGSSVVAAAVDEVAAVLLALARMHAHWWQDPRLGAHPGLRLTSMLAPAAVTEVFERAWPSFLAKLSLPLGDELASTKHRISDILPIAATTLLERGPRTLVHNDVQADNLFFTLEPSRPVVFVDWQLVTYGRCVVDVAAAIRGMLEVEDRHLHEEGLIGLYHDALVGAGVRDYSFEECRADYDLATVLAPARLASAVGLHPGLRAHPGAPWDTLFPRLASS